MIGQNLDGLVRRDLNGCMRFEMPENCFTPASSIQNASSNAREVFELLIPEFFILLSPIRPAEILPVVKKSAKPL